MTNSLLADSALPRFEHIEPAHIFPAVEHVLGEYRQTVENILAANSHYTWDNLCQPLEEASDKLSRVWSPVSHLHSVKNSPELREAYEQCLPLLSEFSTWMGQHEPLYQAYKSLKEDAGFNQLSQAQRKSIENTLRDFELSGIGLPAEKQQRYGEIVARLSEIASKFGNNVLDLSLIHI